jgi:glycosyltransferase involved in cell wall biosynthesis
MSQYRIGIYAPQTADGEAGGVQQFIIGLVDGLRRQSADNLEYVLITHPFNPDWLEPYAGTQMEVTARPPDGIVERIGTVLGRFRPAVEPVAKRLLAFRSGGIETSVPVADEWFDSLDLDVLHFPVQHYFRTDIDTVYNPHDLQHRHLPEFFGADERRRRDTVYQVGCEESTVVAVASNWVKNDIVEQYGIEESKIVVIPTAPPVEAYSELTEAEIESTKQTYDLPDSFGFYPAQSWPHKNHERLVEAVAKLRDQRGLRVNIILTGKQNDHWPAVTETIAQHDLSDQITHLGFVSTTELRSLYSLSTFTIIPTLFEAASLPMFEAWYEGSPVACSDVTSLPEFAGDAAEIFDPSSTPDIADAIELLATDSGRRRELVQRGQERGSQFSWKKTAEKYVEVYKSIADNDRAQVSDAAIPIANSEVDND